MFVYGIPRVLIFVDLPVVRTGISVSWAVPVASFAPTVEFLVLIGGASGFELVGPAGLAE